MGPPSYVRSIVCRNVVIRRIPVCVSYSNEQWLLGSLYEVQPTRPDVKTKPVLPSVGYVVSPDKSLDGFSWNSVHESSVKWCRSRIAFFNIGTVIIILHLGNVQISNPTFHIPSHISVKFYTNIRVILLATVRFGKIALVKQEMSIKILFTNKCTPFIKHIKR